MADAIQMQNNHNAATKQEPQRDATTRQGSKMPPFYFVLVDDEVHLVEAFSKLLNLQGHHATCFSDASSALQFITEHPSQCDALITDYAMPNMDGLTLVQQVRAINQHIIIVIMTGYAELTHEEKFVRSGADLVILKPIRVSELLALLTPKIVGH